jgi:hypothetical protein
LCIKEWFHSLSHHVDSESLRCRSRSFRELSALPTVEG